MARSWMAGPAPSLSLANVRDGGLATAGVLVDTEADGHRVAFNEAFKQKGVKLV